MNRRNDHRVVAVNGFEFVEDSMGRFVNAPTGIRVYARPARNAPRRWNALRVVGRRVEHLLSLGKPYRRLAFVTIERAIRAALTYWGFHAAALTA